MNKMLEELLDLDKPVLTEKLAPKLAPFAKFIYLIGLVIIAFVLLTALKWLISGEVYQAVSVFVGVVAELAILRMFCEYLASTAHKK